MNRTIKFPLRPRVLARSSSALLGSVNDKELLLTQCGPLQAVDVVRQIALLHIFIVVVENHSIGAQTCLHFSAAVNQ